MLTGLLEAAARKRMVTHLPDAQRRLARRAPLQLQITIFNLHGCTFKVTTTAITRGLMRSNSDRPNGAVSQHGGVSPHCTMVDRALIVDCVVTIVRSSSMLI